MYIKKLTIKGFKTFHNETMIELFHPHVNIIVGKNGSGKTNLLTAIQFIFSKEYATLNQRQIDSLISNKQARGKISASVEIIFDNSDKILDINETEITIKRMIQAGKSYYFFNGKSINNRKALIEMFSSSPIDFFGNYFMIKQGSINEIAMASDKYRLNIILEVIGAKEYKLRVKENQCLKTNISSMMNKEQKLVERLTKQQVLLEKEYHDNKEFRQLDGKKRLLEYAIATKKIQSNETKEKNLAEIRDQLWEEQAENKKRFSKIEQKMKEIDSVIQEKTEELNVTLNKETEFKLDLTVLNLEEEKIKEKVIDLQEEIQEAKNEKKSIEKNLKSLNKEIDSKLQIIEQTNLNLDPIEQNIEELKKLIVQESEELGYLYSKIQRIEKYPDKNSRIESLRNDIKHLEKLLEMEKHRLQKVQVDDRKMDEEKLELENKIKEIKEKMKKLEIDEENRKQNLKSIEDKLEVIVNKKKNYIEKKHELEEEKRCVEMNFDKQRKKLEAIVGEPILLGKENIEKILQSRDENSDLISHGYHQFVIDCFEYDEDLDKAVEAVAGRALFRYVFNTHNQSKTVMDELQNKKLPSGSDFLALEHVKVFRKELSSSNGTLPLINRLKYNLDVHDMLIRSIFGNVLVCKDFEIASKISIDKKIVCVTLDGDISYPNGMIVGGYIENENSYIKIYQSLKKISVKIEEIDASLEYYSKKINVCNNVIDQYYKEKVELNILGFKHEHENDELIKKLPGDEFMLERITSYANNIEECSNEFSKDFNSWTIRLKKLKEELESDFVKEITTEDLKRIDELKHNKTIKLLSEEELKKDKIAKSKFVAEIMLNEKLYKTRDQLKEKLTKIDIDTKKIELEALINELAKIESEKYEEKLKACEEQSDVIKNLKNQLETINHEKNKLDKQKKKLGKDIDSHDSEISLIIREYQQVKENIAEIKKEIDEIICLPNDENYPDFRNLTKLSMKHLRNRVLEINRKLQKFPNININVNSEYIALKEPLTMVNNNVEKMLEQITMVNEISERIEQISINTLHQMFKTINQNFKEIFQKLMPQGDAELIMITNTGSYNVDESASMNIDEFTGIGINISLVPGKKIKVHELSGGQKTLVALALIFGIHKCCPAPFYLFDEIDHALDEEHRHIVGEMIQEMSMNAQLLMITFRPELVEFGNKFFQVQCQNSVSRVVNFTKEEALNFIRHA